MALDSLTRWQMIREIILDKKTGTLILQIGRNYLHWIVDAGSLLCVSSTLPDYSFTQFVLNNSAISHEDALLAQSQITGSRSFGAALVQMKLTSYEELRDLLRRHWFSLSYYLLQSTSHLFWSDHRAEPKSGFIGVNVSLSDAILASERSSVEIPCALRTVQELQAPYRVIDLPAVEPFLQDRERRITQYLKAGGSLAEILRDPELDRMTCYKTLFLLWLSGHLHDPQPKRPVVSNERNSLLERIRSVPADWIFPLIAGLLIGVLLAPNPAPLEKPHPPQKTETLKDALQKPAWRTVED